MDPLLDGTLVVYSRTKLVATPAAAARTVLRGHKLMTPNIDDPEPFAPWGDRRERSGSRCCYLLPGGDPCLLCASAFGVCCSSMFATCASPRTQPTGAKSVSTQCRHISTQCQRCRVSKRTLNMTAHVQTREALSLLVSMWAPRAKSRVVLVVNAVHHVHQTQSCYCRSW